MSGRIRTVKPEWLEDERMAASSDATRVLSIAIILIADDYGRGRASVAHLASAAWAYELERNDGADAPEILRKCSGALRDLAAMSFVTLYTVDGQRYFEIRNWEKHQKVSHKGKERVPSPPPVCSPIVPTTSASSGNPPESHRSPSGGSPAILLPDLRPGSPITDPEGNPPSPPRDLANVVRSKLADVLRAAGRPVPPLDTSSKCARIAEWCTDHARATGASFDDVLDALARGFASAAGRTAKAGWPMAYLVANPGEYIRLAPSNPALGGGETDEQLLADLRRTA